MNREDITFLLQNPTSIDTSKTALLNEVVEMYPYFQAARVIQLKALKSTNSVKYNQSLKKTAAYTIDRQVLFEFITSQNFTKNNYKENPVLEEIEIIDPEIVQAPDNAIDNTFKSEVEPVPKEIKVEDSQIETATNETILEIGKPLQFNSTEPHSFNEWMQLISTKPIIREEISNNSIEKITKNEDKFNLIDQFIELNPKIKPIDKNAMFQDVITEQSTESESLMTETLAKVYLEQKKYESAIKAYRILSLKYPEKSGFFADRIKAIKNLQKNKS
ncbi:hypothetical protein SAMN06265371_103386 [Lutibacter agarilyticus]|uniref:Tetratricopeptide repeat-containing protein n=1 Tax=Lutibacter agarilyticus TaxID=1109740 RepID=A0A238WMK9_9FLAO|nr:hypothetical protein [Lutibacter agarilyticus]SNR47782.1 hypothetical protein SAMN06265371_103386 [Lutibacter agarilyticus]